MECFHIIKKNLIEVKKKSSYNLRSNDELWLAPPMFKSKKTLRDRAFQVAAPTLWNKLPSTLRMETSLKPFKTKLKTLLYGLRLLTQTFANVLTQTRLTKGVLRQQRCYVLKTISLFIPHFCVTFDARSLRI